MATTNSPQFIADWYRSCIATFENVTRSVDNLAPNLDSAKALALQLVQDQIGRFRVWAGNMGAHHPARSRMSLDHKLKEASHIHDMVVELLEELNTSLEMLHCSTQQNLLNPDLILEQAEETDGDCENNGMELDDTVSDSGSAASSDSPLSDFVFKLDDIANIISCLYNLSAAMRQPVPQDRLKKYAAIDLSHYESFDNRHVLEKFPNAKPFLIQRLGNANTQRRQYFRYRLLHYEKIAQGVEQVGPATSVPESLYTDLHAVHHDADLAQDNYITSQRATNDDAATVITAAKTSTTISIVPKGTVVRTQPTLDIIETESDGGQTATSYGTIMETGKVKLLKVPDPPNADHVFDGNAFQCPYCYSLIIVQNSRAWQRHVFRDLRPYVCTFDSCTKPNRLFETRHDWYDHEVRHHRREWYCAECTVTCTTSSNFSHHIKKFHPALSDVHDISALVENCERVVSTPQQCPLCTVQSEHTTKGLRSHLGRHMQQLALFTLPRLEVDDNGGEDVPSEAGLRGMESSSEEDKDNMSELEFHSNSSEDRPEKESEGAEGGAEEGERVKPEDHPGEENRSGDDEGLKETDGVKVRSGSDKPRR
ncbi:hypothetical protein EV426DRAFT_707592 [Tirmania nivea]|nr:hypothetical protein EV426DRAFT_707592 [Tirmania nivea]